MRTILFVIFVFLVSCASPQSKLLEAEKNAAMQDEATVEETKDMILKLPGPDGSEHILVKCYRAAVCYKIATKVCGTYSIAHSFFDVYGYGNQQTSSTHTSLSMLIKCGNK